MSLSSLLLGVGSATTSSETNTKGVDKDLDALFRSNPAPSVASSASKGHKITIPSNPPRPSPTSGRKRKRQHEGPSIDPAPRAASPFPVETISSKAPKRKKTQKHVEQSDGSEDDEADDTRLEDGYLTRQTLQKAPTNRDGILAHDSSDEDDQEAEPPRHETHDAASASRTRTKPRKKTKYVPPEETPAQRDARTIFIGNVPVDVAKSKSSQKQLKRHFTSRIIGCKVESVRFRSVAFATATSTLPAEDGKPHKPDTPSTKQQRQQERAAQWREGDKGKGKHGQAGDTSDREENDSAKKPTGLNPAEKKRVAFIKGDFHKEVDTVNAYIVFAHSPPAEEQTEMEAGALRPSEAARLAVERCDGTSFLEHTIRVDRVGKWREGATGPSVDPTSDPRKTLFVGNLDFAAKEEELRVWLEGVVSQERGPPGEGEDEGDSANEDMDDGEGKEKEKTWVKSVRIVRDRDTLLGKGFAYVRFVDRDCVDEILALEQSKLKFAKRLLRVQRCKVVPAAGGSAPNPKSKSAVSPKKAPAKHAKSAPMPMPMPIPRGDPALGTQLASLSKEDRKAAKAANVDRVQRRLAKKKMKAEVDKAKMKTKEMVSGGGPGKTRDRERERKKGGKGGGKGKAVSKGRVRSEKSVEKRNAKK